jgi:hypothetical protein
VAGSGCEGGTVSSGWTKYFFNSASVSATRKPPKLYKRLPDTIRHSGSGGGGRSLAANAVKMRNDESEVGG